MKAQNNVKKLDKLIRDKKNSKLPIANVENISKIDFLGARPLSNADEKGKYVSPTKHLDIAIGAFMGLLSFLSGYLAIGVIALLIYHYMKGKQVAYFAIPWAIVFGVLVILFTVIISAGLSN